jgi:hypothetical protein
MDVRTYTHPWNNKTQCLPDCETAPNHSRVEAKLIAVKGGRMPNGEIQRLMGQCTLAKTKHQFVIGICGYRGTLDPRWDNDTQTVRSWLEQAGISFIFRAVSFR